MVSFIFSREIEFGVCCWSFLLRTFSGDH
jgi:hypothetical protein